MSERAAQASAIMRGLVLVVGKWEGDDGGGEIEGCEYIPGLGRPGKKKAGEGTLSTGSKSTSHDDSECSLAFR